MRGFIMAMLAVIILRWASSADAAAKYPDQELLGTVYNYMNGMFFYIVMVEVDRWHKERKKNDS